MSQPENAMPVPAALLLTAALLVVTFLWLFTAPQVKKPVKGPHVVRSDVRGVYR